MRLRVRWQGEDGRLLWFGSSLAPVWSSNDRFIRNMEFIPLKKLDSKSRFNFHRESGFRNGGAFSQRMTLFTAFFVAYFAAAKWGYCVAKWHLCSKGVFRNCETPCEMGL